MTGFLGWKLVAQETVNCHRQFLWAIQLTQATVAGDGYCAALFGYHQTKRVAQFRQSQSRAVSGADMRGLRQILGQRQGSGKTRHSIVLDQYRAVMPG